MSSSQTPTETGECQHCEQPHPIADAVGAFCSNECRLKHRADKALNLIRHDHRICGSCAGVLKSVEPPTEDWKYEHGDRERVALNHGGKLVDADDPEAPYGLDLTECSDRQRTDVDSVIGFEYQTPEAENAIREARAPDEYTRFLQSTTGCVCGSVDTHETSDILREADPVRVLTNYVQTFRMLHDEGQLDHRINKRALFETYKETRDFDLAIARAIYGDYEDHE